MKFVSWNVNGLRSVLKKGFAEFANTYSPDILCLQETKCHPDQLEAEILKPFETQYKIFWNVAEKKGYSGTAVLTKVKPSDVTYGMDMKEHDSEGRVITLEFPEYFLVNVYTPNAGEELKRLSYRLQWDLDFQKYVKALEKKKPVIVGGDLNVAHNEIDLANPQSNRGNSGFTDEERASFTRFLNLGFTDSFREINKEPRQYSWWTYRFGARQRNIGWRIDYFCFSKELRPLMKDAFIRPEVMGSDHCPVGLVLK